MAHNVNQFVAALQGGGARANQFKVSIGDAPGSLEFLCRSAQIPALTIGEIAVPYRGRQIFVPGDRTYDAWTLTMFNDMNYSIRRRIEAWMNDIANIGATVTTAGPEMKVYKDAWVQQLSRNGDAVIRTYHLFGVWPTTLDAIDLAFDTNDTIEEYGITFRFNYLTTGEDADDKSEYDAATGRSLLTLAEQKKAERKLEISYIDKNLRVTTGVAF